MTDKDELEQYEASEARDVMALLKKLKPSRIEPAPSSFQTAVLRRLRAKETPQKRFTWSPWWQVPLSMAAGLILGVFLTPLFFSLERTERYNEPLEFRGRPGELSHVDKQVPEEWLESIAELLVKGQVAQAYLELGEFKTRYPDYEQSAEK